MRIVILLLLGALSSSLVHADNRLKNLSTLGPIGERPFMAGFIVRGERPAWVAITAERYTSSVDPVLRVTDVSARTEWGTNDDWRDTAQSEHLISIIGRELSHPSDAAILLELAPGAYVAHIESGNGQSGACLLAVTVE